MWPSPIQALSDAVGGIEWSDEPVPHQAGPTACSNIVALIFAIAQAEQLIIETMTCERVLSRLPELTDDNQAKLRQEQAKALAKAIKLPVPASEWKHETRRRAPTPRPPPSAEATIAQHSAKAATAKTVPPVITVLTKPSHVVIGRAIFGCLCACRWCGTLSGSRRLGHGVVCVECAKC